MGCQEGGAGIAVGFAIAIGVLSRLFHGFCHGNWRPFATFPWVLPWQVVSFCDFSVGFAMAIGVLSRLSRGLCHSSGFLLRPLRVNRVSIGDENSDPIKISIPPQPPMTELRALKGE